MTGPRFIMDNPVYVPDHDEQQTAAEFSATTNVIDAENAIERQSPLKATEVASQLKIARATADTAPCLTR